MLDNYFNAEYAQILVLSGRAYQDMFTEIRKKIEVAASDGDFETEYSLDEIYHDSVETNKAKLLTMISEDLTDRGFMCTVTPMKISDSGNEYLTLLIAW
jgi:hypothetical protein